MMDWSGHGGFGGMLFGALPMLLWWVLIIAAVFALARWLFGGAGGWRRTSPPDRALDVLRERYARGEIDRDEFQKRKVDLSG